MFLAEIDTAALFEVIWVSIVAGIGVTTVYSIVIYAASRASEARRDGHAALSAVFGGLAILALIAFLAGVGIGVTIMLSKG